MSTWEASVFLSGAGGSGRVHCEVADHLFIAQLVKVDVMQADGQEWLRCVQAYHVINLWGSNGVRRGNRNSKDQLLGPPSFSARSRPHGR